MKVKPITIIAQIEKIQSLKDSGFRFSFNCGLESIDGIKKLMELSGSGNTSVAIAIVPQEMEY